VGGARFNERKTNTWCNKVPKKLSEHKGGKGVGITKKFMYSSKQRKYGGDKQQKPQKAYQKEGLCGNNRSVLGLADWVGTGDRGRAIKSPKKPAKGSGCRKVGSSNSLGSGPLGGDSTVIEQRRGWKVSTPRGKHSSGGGKPIVMVMGVGGTQKGENAQHGVKHKKKNRYMTGEGKSTC